MDTFDASAATGAVALSLASPSRRDRLRRFSDDQWEIELRSGRDRVVARTNKALPLEKLLDEAIEMTHRALDLTSIEDVEHLVTRAPADDHIIWRREDGQTTVRFQAVSDFQIATNTQVEIRRADGTIEHQATPPSPAWTSAFRFHRLSQGNNDLFDAYRNMFLGLEALLDQLWPKGRREQEKVWLLRAIGAAGARVNLVSLATQGTPDPCDDLVTRLYDIRVHLFHAKTGRTLIPDERVSYIKVAGAYPVLVALWTEIVRAWLGLTRGGGVVTYQGFKLLVEKAYGTGRIGLTADDTPPNATDSKASPKDMPVTILPQPVTVLEMLPGRMALTVKTLVSALPVDLTVRRVAALLPNGNPAIICGIMGGLTLDGANVFEVFSVVRLINSGQPRTEFT